MNYFNISYFPDYVYIPLYYLIGFIVVAVLMLFVVLFLVLLERKLLGFFTVRVGPNRVGFHGALQTVADAIKLLFKEDIIPLKADKLLFTLSPILVFAPIMTVWAYIPFNGFFAVQNSVVGSLIFLSLLSFPILGILFAGISSANKYSLLGSLRACAQTLCYELPIFISLLSVVILSGSLDLNDIVSAQSINNNCFGWFIIPSLLGFITFYISSVAMMNRVPFDFPEAESEFVGGYHTEYSGMKFAMFFLAEYASMFILCAFMATIFLGGFLSPFGKYISDFLPLSDLIKTPLIFIEQFFWLILKTMVLVVAVIWTRATLPRLRIDRSLEFFWKLILPLSILNIFIVCLIKLFMGAR
ncbi:NADH-quinone oxidoreductase subunit NuoH [bacterium]|nr:NADH-quinone oxidoreductase subunit NuoH [bacterium]